VVGRLAQRDRRERRVVVDDPAHVRRGDDAAWPGGLREGGGTPLESSVGPDRSVAVHGEHLRLASGGGAAGIGVGGRCGATDPANSVAAAVALTPGTAAARCARPRGQHHRGRRCARVVAGRPRLGRGPDDSSRPHGRDEPGQLRPSAPRKSNVVKLFGG